MSGIINIKKRTLGVLYRAFGWHLKYYFLKRGGPLAATFQLTNRCNLRCVMCNIPNNPMQGVMDLGLFRKIVGGLGEMGCFYASLSGGEVLTIPNYFEYLREAKKRLASVNTVTNGLLLDEWAAREFAIAKADSVSLSLDGMEKGHEYTRARPGAFKRTVEAIGLLKRFSPETKVVVNTVIAPWNIDELYELTDFVERLGVLHKFQPLNEHPRFEGQAKDYTVDKTMDIKKIKELVRFLQKKKNVANSRYFLGSIPDYFARDNRSGLFSERCLLPYFFCEFREDGSMYPCLGGTSWKDGFQAKDGVKEAFYSPEYRDAVKRLEGCRFCQKSYSVCYIEPRVAFPITSLLRYRFLGRSGGMAA